MKTPLLIVLLTLLSFNLLAQPLVIEQNKETISSYALYPYSKIINAGTANISLNEVKLKIANMEAQSIMHDNANVSFTANYYWQTLSILNNTNQTKVYYLEAARPMTDSVILYTEFADGTLKKQLSGDAVPFENRDYQHRKSVFKVELPPQQQLNLYLNLKSDGEVLDLALKLETADEFIISTYQDQLVYGIFYGILFLAGIIYLFFYFALRDKTFLFYALYVFTIGLMQFALDGFWYQYFGPGAGMLSLKGVIVFAALGTLFFGLYGKSYLQINKSFKYLNLAYNIHAVGVLILLAVVLLPIAIPTLSYVIINAFGLMALFIVIISIVALYMRKTKVDWFFTVGILSLVAGITVFIMNNFSLLPNSFATANGSKFGTGAEVIFLSLSMSNLIRKLRSEKEVAQAVALKKSEDMNELKSYFMSNMSHELRTPLNAIMGIADVMIKEKGIDERIKSNFEIIKYSSNSLLSSVNDILDFNQIERGDIRLVENEFEPHQLFNLIKLNAQKQATDKGLVFKFEVSPDIPKAILGDGTRFMQIINNVLNNAVKFTNVGYVDVKIDVSARHDDAIKLKIVISDSGVGIPKDKMDTIYEAFTQESINNKRKFGGLGLGLSIVKKLVDLYQGKINIESKVGQGTKCTLELPFTVITNATTEDSLTPPALAQEPEIESKPINILLVEDNSMNQLLMKMMMKHWENTTFSIANHGQECLKMLQQDKYDIILMDLQMPIMDGYEATIAIRAGEAGVGNINIPIIALTADVMEGTEQRVKQIGMDKYLTKPINQDLLYKSVLELTNTSVSV